MQRLALQENAIRLRWILFTLVEEEKRVFDAIYGNVFCAKYAIWYLNKMSPMILFKNSITLF